MGLPHFQTNKKANHVKLKPILFTRIENQTEIPAKKVSDVPFKDVSHRFLKLGSKNFGIYELEGRTINVLEPEVFRKYSDILFELINYRWTQKLEECNSSSRISKKVRGADRENINRGNLSRFKEYLYLENPECRCFITDDKISDNESVDHVIPWSYLFSDDPWNLVLVKKCANSSKSNNVPDEGLIKKLDERNIRLLKLLESLRPDKHTEELKLAIDDDYIRKFWVGCRG